MPEGCGEDTERGGLAAFAAFALFFAGFGCGAGVMEAATRREESASCAGAGGYAQGSSCGEASDGDVGVEGAELPRSGADLTSEPSEGFTAFGAVGGEGSVGSGSKALCRDAESDAGRQVAGGGERFGAMLASDRADLVGDLAIFLFDAKGGEGESGGGFALL